MLTTGVTEIGVSPFKQIHGPLNPGESRTIPMTVDLTSIAAIDQLDSQVYPAAINLLSQTIRRRHRRHTGDLPGSHAREDHAVERRGSAVGPDRVRRRRCARRHRLPRIAREEREPAEHPRRDRGQRKPTTSPRGRGPDHRPDGRHAGPTGRRRLSHDRRHAGAARLTAIDAGHAIHRGTDRRRGSDQQRRDGGGPVRQPQHPVDAGDIQRFPNRRNTHARSAARCPARLRERRPLHGERNCQPARVRSEQRGLQRRNAGLARAILTRHRASGRPTRSIDRPGKASMRRRRPFRRAPARRWSCRTPAPRPCSIGPT